MAIQRSSVGLDLGAHSIKVVQVRVTRDGASLEKSVVLQRSELEPQGVDDPKALATTIRNAMVSAGIPTKSVVFGLDAAASMLRYTHMPPMAERRLQTVMEYEVESVSDRMEEALASDYSMLGIRREDGDRTILLGLAKEAQLEELLGTFEGAGITIRESVPAAVALYSAWDLYGEKDDPDSPDDDLVLAVDMGRNNLHVALILNNRLAFARSASFGGENFTEALSEALSLSRDDAERVKISRGGMLDSLPRVNAKTVGPMRSMAGQLTGMVQSSMRFATSQAGVSLPQVTRIWCMGGGFKLRGLPEYLSRSLGNAAVEMFEPVADREQASGDCVGMALGLSSVGLRSESAREVSVNILPSSYLKRRIFREKTIFVYAAIAMLVLFLGARLTHGLVVSFDADGKKSSLRAQLSELEQKRSERDENLAQSREIRARINFLLLEAETTAFQSFLLQLLGDTLRPEIQLDSIALLSDERTNNTGFDYSVQVKGRISDEKHKGYDWLIALQESLIQEERVADVLIHQSDPEGQWVVFELEIKPNTQRI